MFPYQEVLNQEIEWLDGVVRANKPRQLPAVLPRDEVRTVWRGVSGPAWLLASRLYGAGLRRMEGLRLRVNDGDVADHQIGGRDGQGDKHRVTVLPLHVTGPLQCHWQDVATGHARDLEAGCGRVYWPSASGRKYLNADRAWAWQ